MDNAPKYRQQTLTWMLSLKACGALETLQPIVHYVGPQPSDVLDQLEGLGATVLEVEPFGSGPAAYCNKLQQLPTFMNSAYDEIILSDADIAFVKDPAELLGQATVRAKIVDKPNPGESVLSELLERAGFRDAEIAAHPDFAPEHRTHKFNCNGGMYVLPGYLVGQINSRWRHWSSFCLAQDDLLGSKTLHSDQLGFMLSMIELKLPFSPLPVGANYPTHFSAEHYPHDLAEPIIALHYHSRLDEQGRLLATGNIAIDGAVHAVNRQIAETRAALARVPARSAA